MTEPPKSAATTLGEAVTAAQTILAGAGVEDAALEARLIVGHFTGTGRTEALVEPDRPLTAEQAAAIEDALARRLDGEPVFRILGRRDFHGVSLGLSSHTLEPRPDTETLVDLVLPELLKRGDCRILDMGTGSGAIALALLAELPQARAVGSDIERGALEMAFANAELNDLSDRFSTCLSNWFEEIEGRFHAIVANPPYIPSGEIDALSREVREHDPRLALDGGPDGLDAYRILARGAAAHLEPGGLIAVEIGHDQKDAVVALFAESGWALRAHARDLGGRDRALMFAATPR